MGKICGTAQCEDAGITNVDEIDILNNTEGAMTSYVIQAKKLKRIISMIDVEKLMEEIFIKTCLLIF